MATLQLELSDELRSRLLEATTPEEVVVALEWAIEQVRAGETPVMRTEVGRRKPGPFYMTEDSTTDYVPSPPRNGKLVPGVFVGPRQAVPHDEPKEPA